MVKKVINTSRSAKADASYSQAVKAGDLVFTAGTTGVDPKTNELVAPGEIGPQTRQTMLNLKAILEDSGTCMENIIKTTVYISDLNDFWKFDEEYQKFFNKDNFPARSTIEVSRLPTWVCLEIEAVALIP